MELKIYLLWIFFMAFKAAAEFCTGHPSCKSKHPSQCSVFLYTSGKSLHTINTNRLPSKRTWYWWHRATPRPGHSATMKCVFRPPVLARLPLVVHKWFSPSDFFPPSHRFCRASFIMWIVLVCKSCAVKIKVSIFGPKVQGIFQSCPCNFHALCKISRFHFAFSPQKSHAF